MPHLSPRNSSEDTPAVSLDGRKRKLKRASFAFGKKDRLDHEQASTSEEHADSPDTSNEASEPSTSQAKGPDLRLLPIEEDAPANHKADRYVELPRGAANEQRALHPIIENRMKYEWDYVMEHQRGFRFLSTPLFSGAGLLPMDPPPFATIGPAPIPCSLEDFQLPSPEWRWAGDGWCVDMRGDGEVQEDGFEYNWWFRQKGWRPMIGFWSTGAYVRRRRWMRLRYLTPPETSAKEPSSPPASPPHHDELQGWERLKSKMKDTELDRERLDIIETWLDESGSNEDVLREHWTEVLQMFVFPMSRDLLRTMVQSMGWKALPQGDERIFWKITT